MTFHLTPRVDDEGQDYGRPFKRIADDRDRDGRGVSQIGPNNSSHTTKKKGRKKTKFNTHENTFFLFHREIFCQCL